MKTILIIGGDARSLLNVRGKLIQKWIERGYKVIASAAGENAAVTKELNYIGVEYRSLKIKRASISPISDIILFFQILLLMILISPDVLFTYGVKPNIYGMISGSVARVKYKYAMITGLGFAFISIDSHFRALVNSAVKFLYRVSLKQANIVFFQNNDDISLFRELNIISTRVRAVRLMGSGVDLKHFERKAIKVGPVTFLFVGRLLIEKGIKEYVDAAKILIENNINCKFAVLGSVDLNPTSISLSTVKDLFKDDLVEYWGSADDVCPPIFYQFIFNQVFYCA